MLRRGGVTHVKKAGVDRDLIDLMGRWRENLRNKDPHIMQQRYFGMSCEDGLHGDESGAASERHRLLGVLSVRKLIAPASPPPPPG